MALWWFGVVPCWALGVGLCCGAMAYGAVTCGLWCVGCGATGCGVVSCGAVMWRDVLCGAVVFLFVVAGAVVSRAVVCGAVGVWGVELFAVNRNVCLCWGWGGCCYFGDCFSHCTLIASSVNPLACLLNAH